MPAELDAPANDGAWQNFRAKVELPAAGYYEAWARATDSECAMQPTPSTGTRRGTSTTPCTGWRYGCRKAELNSLSAPIPARSGLPAAEESVVEDMPAAAIRCRHGASSRAVEHITNDVNRAWTPALAVEVMNAASAHGWFEQPCKTFDQCAQVRRPTNQPIMLDECLLSFRHHLTAWRGWASLRMRRDSASPGRSSPERSDADLTPGKTRTALLNSAPPTRKSLQMSNR